RSGLTADVAFAMGWSPDQRLVSATKPSHQEAIPANSDAPPASAGSFNPLIQVLGGTLYALHKTP
ncbi:MAG: hypothetical protein RQ750_18855, partial [Roseovarius sp.]|nr:hypothetical protein [Roseovarius sp.]